MNFRTFRVARKVKESDIITSFYLEPVDGAPLAPFQAGQFLTFKFPVTGDPSRDHIVRTYSVSSAPHEPGHYRITVKREPAPPDRPDLPPGAGSVHLHDDVPQGALIEAADPRGDFFLAADSARPVVLLSGGVGLTPLVSMLHALSRTTRDVVFIHACDHGGVHALRDEVLALARSRPGIRAHFVYRTPKPDDIARKAFDSEGLVSRALLQQLLPLDEYDFYLCGPTPFMTAVYQTLRGLGVPQPRIKYEFFGPATVLESVKAEAPKPVEAQLSAPAPAAGTGPRITFARSGKAADWNNFKGSLLEFAEAQGLNPDFSCRAGVCSTCKCGLKRGTVAYIDEPLDPPEAGQVLICVSRPTGDVELDI
jgi:ferredoxin-NADP reductase